MRTLEARGSLMFLGGIEREHWPGMDLHFTVSILNSFVVFFFPKNVARAHIFTFNCNLQKVTAVNRMNVTITVFVSLNAVIYIKCNKYGTYHFFLLGNSRIF